MITIQHLCDFLTEFAPPQLAEDWDNVGLLVGDASRPASKLMTCLTVTPASAEEAVQAGVDVIVTHHPLPFRAFKQITAQSTPGRLLLTLISAGVAIYSPHTAFDSAAAGINQRLAEGLGLESIEPLIPSSEQPALGAGRRGQLRHPQTIAELAQHVKDLLHVRQLQMVGSSTQSIRSVAVACGSAGQLLSAAHANGCELFVTGETSFHTCLEAQALGMALLLPGHYASERFAVEQLAQVLAARFPALTVWASQSERDPLEWL